MQYDNPAARFLNILLEGRAFPPEIGCRGVWEKILQTNETSKLMSRLGKVMELPSQIISNLAEGFPSQVGTWSHWENQVNAAFMVQNLNGRWDSFSSHIDEHSITYLRLASDLLQSKANTKLLVDEEITALRTKLQDIYSDIETSSVQEEVRKFILRHLKELINGIDEYKISGALPILDSISAAVGHTVMDVEYKNFLFDTDLGKKILDTLSSAANVVTVAVGLPQLTQAIALLTK